MCSHGNKPQFGCPDCVLRARNWLCPRCGMVNATKAVWCLNCGEYRKELRQKGRDRTLKLFKDRT